MYYHLLHYRHLNHRPRQTLDFYFDALAPHQYLEAHQQVTFPSSSPIFDLNFHQKHLKAPVLVVFQQLIFYDLLFYSIQPNVAN